MSGRRYLTRHRATVTALRIPYWDKVARTNRMAAAPREGRASALVHERGFKRKMHEIDAAAIETDHRDFPTVKIAVLARTSASSSCTRQTAALCACERRRKERPLLARTRRSS